MAIPYTCPVCGGKGKVLTGFYDNFYVATTVNTELCKSCWGSGIVWDYSQWNIYPQWQPVNPFLSPFNPFIVTYPMTSIGSGHFQ